MKHQAVKDSDLWETGKKKWWHHLLPQLSARGDSASPRAGRNIVVSRNRENSLKYYEIKGAKTASQSSRLEKAEK